MWDWGGGRRRNRLHGRDPNDYAHYHAGGEGPVIVMHYHRKTIVEALRRAGLPELADEAAKVLPDPVDLNQLETWGSQHGITRDELISRLGGSS